MTLDEQTVSTLVAELQTARDRNEQVEPLTDRHELTLEDAYRIQSRLLEELYTGTDHRRIGYKVGVTNEEGQAALGAEEPASGVLFDDMLVTGNRVESDSLIDPRFEPEIGFLIDRELPANATFVDVLAATNAILPVIEIADSRIEDWNVQIQDMVADNALASGFLVGDAVWDLSGIDLSMESVQILVNGERTETGTAANVLGHPVRSVSWLANALEERDDPFTAEELVLSGSLTSPIAVEQGETMTVRFATFGDVTVHIS